MRLTAAASLLAVAAISLPLPVLAQEELRVRQLENEVRTLQREVAMQSQRIDRLETSARSTGPAPPQPAAPARAEDSSPAWLVSTNWDKLRTGMKELEVIALLGRPTSVRTDENAKTRTMFYAMELGPNSFLTGKVTFGDAGVTEINRPTLR